MSNSGRVRWRTLRRSIQAVGAALCLAMLCAKSPRPRSASKLRLEIFRRTRWQRGSTRRWRPAGRPKALFLRRRPMTQNSCRASLDILGKIPAASEVRAFLRDQTPNKRRRLIYGLLARGGFANHFANTWRELLLPGANTNAQTRALAPPLEAWLRLRFAENAPYDRLVSELLTPAALPGAQPARRPPPLRPPVPWPFFRSTSTSPKTWRPTRLDCSLARRCSAPSVTITRSLAGSVRSSGRWRRSSAVRASWPKAGLCHQ